MVTIKSEKIFLFKRTNKILFALSFIFILSCNNLEDNKKINNLHAEKSVNLCIYCHKKRNVKNCKYAKNSISTKNCLKCHKGNKNHHGFKIKESPAF